MRFRNRVFIASGLGVVLAGCLGQSHAALVRPPPPQAIYQSQTDNGFYRTNQWEADEFHLDGRDFRIIKGKLYAEGSSEPIFSFERGEYLEVDCLGGDGILRASIDRENSE